MIRASWLSSHLFSNEAQTRKYTATPLARDSRDHPTDHHVRHEGEQQGDDERFTGMFVSAKFALERVEALTIDALVALPDRGAVDAGGPLTRGRRFRLGGVGAGSVHAISRPRRGRQRCGCCPE